MKVFKGILLIGGLITFIWMPSHILAEHRVEMASNPCAVKNPCTQKQPCSMNQPCSAKQPCSVEQPCSISQPCGMKDGEAKSFQDVIDYGKKLWKDPSLGKSGLSCATCHEGGRSFKETARKPYPHYVSMPNRVVTLDQMINFCMKVPMKAEPLAWDSEEMTAIAAYLENVVLKEVRASASHAQ